MMAVDIDTMPTLTVSKPKQLFEGQYEPTLVSAANYDVAARRTRLLRRLMSCSTGSTS